MSKVTRAVKVKWESYSDQELKAMLVRLGTKHPESYTKRVEMIEVLEVNTREVADPNWQNRSDEEMRTMLNKLGVVDKNEELTRPEMVQKLDKYTEVANTPV